MRVGDFFNEFLNYLKIKGYTPHTICEYERFLLKIFDNCPIKDIEIKKLKLTDLAYIINSGSLHGQYGAQRAVSVFRCYLKYLHEKGIKLPIDWRDIILPKVPVRIQPVLTIKELEFFLDSLPLNHKNAGTRRVAWVMRALFEVLFATGLRISEALELRRSDFEKIKKNKELIITGKGKNERRVFFSNRAIDFLEKYLKQREDNSEWLFVNCFGEKLKITTAKSYLLRFRKKLGYLKDKIKFHTFRRTLATYLLKMGADAKTIQIILGHKSLRTTLRYYTIIGVDEAKEIYQKIMTRSIVDNST